MTEQTLRNKESDRKYYGSALILYLSFFIHGIGASLLGQQVIKEFLAGQWGTGVEQVTLIAAALGLGRLLSLPFSGPISDRLGRKVSIIIGLIFYALFFGGIALSPNIQVAYLAAICGGAANSFLDTGVIPACVEILKPNSGLATMLTKLFISLAQLLMPFMLGIAAATAMSYRFLMLVSVIALIVLGILVIGVKLPIQEGREDGGEKRGFVQSIKEARFSIESVALILIGFTCTATFQLWLNCAQTFGKEVAGMASPGIMQTYYSMGTILAIFVTAVLVSKVKAVRFLALYPAIATVTLILVFLIKTPTICLIGSFVIGYSAAGGVLQLATATVNDLFPHIKGTITSIIMIASSLSNYTILSLAGKLGTSGGPKAIMMMNIIITAIGVALALFVNVRYQKLLDRVSKD